MKDKKRNQRYSNDHNQQIEPDPEVRVVYKRRQRPFPPPLCSYLKRPYGPAWLLAIIRVR
ncbi:MAG: hypothetical protein R6X34_13690 [Chloroflexota bacterium]